MDLQELLNGQCREYPKGSPTLSPEAVQERLALVPGWELVESGTVIRYSDRLADFLTVIGLVNKVADVAEEQQHHPDIRIHSYRSLEIEFSTHSIGGLTDNDFIMAARVNQLRGA